MNFNGHLNETNICCSPNVHTYNIYSSTWFLDIYGIATNSYLKQLAIAKELKNKAILLKQHRMHYYVVLSNHVANM